MLHESSPRSKILTSARLYNLVDEHMPMAWWDFYSVLAIFSTTMLFIAKVAPRAAGGVMTLSPRDAGTCSHEHG
jgi:hypothetical protein